MKLFDQYGIREILKSRAKKEGSERKLAESLRVSYSYMNDLIRGKRRPGKKILDAIGFREVRVYAQTREGESK